jgi:hypothetical protein
MSRNMNMLTSDAFIGKIELFLSWTIDQLGFRVLFQLNRRSLVVVAAGQGMPCAVCLKKHAAKLPYPFYRDAALPHNPHLAPILRIRPNEIIRRKVCLHAQDHIAVLVNMVRGNLVCRDSNGPVIFQSCIKMGWF